MKLVALPSVYHLDIDLPYLMDVDNVGAQFNKDTRVCICGVTWVGGTNAAVTFLHLPQVLSIMLPVTGRALL